MLPVSPTQSVFNKVKEIQQLVGVECEGYKEQFMALLAAIDFDHSLVMKSAFEKQRELKRLTWSLNCEGSASRHRSEGKRLAASLWSLKFSYGMSEYSIRQISI